MSIPATSRHNPPATEDPHYLQQQILTYIGNKRALIPFILRGLEQIQTALGTCKISFLDLFCGSGVVSRYARSFAHTIFCNDLEHYSYVTNECYQTSIYDLDISRLQKWAAKLQQLIDDKPRSGFLSKLYAPQNDHDIKKGERVFYTQKNALFLDSFCQYLTYIPQELRIYLLAPMIYQASSYANTAGVFKGFYKKNGIGHFGGKGADALKRITHPMKVILPYLSHMRTRSHVFREDANTVITHLPCVDVAYFDPPYNQHPYGSNYFMLNLLCNYRTPQEISDVSGIPKNWTRSRYNKRLHAAPTLFDAIENVRAKFVLLSYNEEGFISRREFLRELSRIGHVDVMDQKYMTFRGCRNFSGRNTHVTEQLYLLDKR